jgi:eukaryotic-like serine/threonine-protein kinase
MTAFDPRRWRRMQPLLDQVLDLPPEQRRAWLDEACAGDPDLRADVEEILRADAEEGGLLDGATGAAVEDLLRKIEESRVPTVGMDPRTATHLEGVLRRLLRQGHAADESEEGGLLPGTVLANRYRIVNLLGQGGMGKVYRADDLKLGQVVALKFLPEELQGEPAALHRFLDEVKLARQISHPNVCRVYDVTEADGRHFLSMEYVDGEDLASLLKRIGHLPKEKSLDIARQLCAGLAAAHEAGILHRDLKPANVMLDGKGRVRITDFGLAVAAEQLEGRHALAGTPAYMAPEQLEGRETTSRSDLYALGLVLYELFTGKRAFPASTLEEARRLREESTPTSPSALVDGFDPAVERAILRCLESDPALRPASARAVAATLPGGDPLAAAVAAGETPSPELVAAAGPEGALKPAVSFGILAATLAMLVVLALLADQSSILGWSPWTRSADVLEDSVRGTLRTLGHDGSPVDRARMVRIGSLRYVRYVEGHDASPGRWKHLRDPGEQVGVFFYRQGTRYLAPLGTEGRVTTEDPPYVPGDVVAATDLRGRLIYLQSEPQDLPPPAVRPTVDWALLFREAGLDIEQFREVPPTLTPPVFADVTMAWTGVLRDFGGYPVRVEAAARGGTPVFFEVVLPWDPEWDSATRKSSPRPQTPTLLGLLVPVLVSVGVVVGIRNWRNGRGDRRGAFRLAAAVFFLRLGVWILGGHHVASLRPEWILLITAVGKSLADAGFTWVLYLAVEPYGRRLHPRFLVSWTRLLRGRFADPLVGRDILWGAALGSLYAVFYLRLHVAIPHALGLRAPPPPMGYPGGRMPYMYFLDPPPAQTALGGRHVLEALLARPLTAFGILIVITILLLGLKSVLRKNLVVWIAFTAMAAAGAPPSAASRFSAVGVGCGIAAAIVLLSALRFGLVGTFVVLWCSNIVLNFPITAKLDAPFFSIGLVGLLAIAALATYGAFTAARPRSLMRSSEVRLAA